MRFLLTLLVISCGSPAAGRPTAHSETSTEPTEQDEAPQVRAEEQPPESGPVQEVHFPPIARSTLENGLELDVVEHHRAPVAYIRLVIRSGSGSDPEGRYGLADLVAQMLTEGTRRKTAQQLAERIESLGADIAAGADADNLYIVMRTLSEHLEECLSLLSEVITIPVFREDELNLRLRRERDRLAAHSRRPTFIARQALLSRLYGDHPYARIDSDPQSLQQIHRGDLVRWHRRHFVPSNALLVVVGDTSPEQTKAWVEQSFGNWAGAAAPPEERAAPPARTQREIILIDRPGSTQSVLMAGNVAVDRSDEDFVALVVANQVLGGDAASRLFRELRERRGLTYGAFSGVGERVDPAPFIAEVAVRTEATAQAVQILMSELERIAEEPIESEELEAAQRYLADAFPLEIETPADIASMVADLRIHGLEDDHWDTHRSAIRAVTAEQALAAAREHIRPGSCLFIAVGEAASIVEPLRRWGPVTVLDEQGRVRQSFEAMNREEPPGS